MLEGWTGRHGGPGALARAQSSGERVGRGQSPEKFRKKEALSLLRGLNVGEEEGGMGEWEVPFSRTENSGKEERGDDGFQACHAEGEATVGQPVQWK